MDLIYENEIVKGCSFVCGGGPAVPACGPGEFDTGRKTQ